MSDRELSSVADEQSRPDSVLRGDLEPPRCLGHPADPRSREIAFRGSLGVVSSGHGEFADYVASVTDALADYRCDIEAMVAEADRVAARMMFSGRHRASFLGVSATNRRVAWAGVAFFTFTDGLVSDLWVLGDLCGLHQQLGGPD